MIDWRQEVRERLARLKLEPTREAEIVEELSQDLEDRYTELLSRGATEEAASHVLLAELSENELLQQELRRIERTINHGGHREWIQWWRCDASK